MTQKYLGFPVSDDLLQRVEAIVVDFEQTENRRPDAMRFFQIVSDLSDEGFGFFFIESLRRAGMGRLTLSAVDKSLKIGKKAILSVAKRMIKKMDDEQLLTMVHILKESITVREKKS
ncbi:MAG: hypothetical protein ACRBFS_14955 [Aureispira sp.]